MGNIYTRYNVFDMQSAPITKYIKNFKLGFTVQTKTTSSIVDVNDFIFNILKLLL